MFNTVPVWNFLSLGEARLEVLFLYMIRSVLIRVLYLCRVCMTYTMWRFLIDVQPPKLRVKNAAEKREVNKKYQMLLPGRQD